MIDIKQNLPGSLITNIVTVKSDNSFTCTSSNSLLFMHQTCLIISHYVNKVSDKLSYRIYILNNLERDIYDVKLIDTLPEGVDFVSTSVENGQYSLNEGKVFYDISIIEPNSFCTILLNVFPTTLGEKINSIEVLDKYANYTIPNPSTAYINVW